ncbi:hypothetical protein K438DRAFT_312021 [Mycena galopus ATCC 62051]|nr:hypothetical protein K438DRAFT_312021 [Mycena galopus ATCC 62051]
MHAENAWKISERKGSRAGGSKSCSLVACAKNGTVNEAHRSHAEAKRLHGLQSPCLPSYQASRILVVAPEKFTMTEARQNRAECMRPIFATWKEVWSNILELFVFQMVLEYPAT